MSDEYADFEYEGYDMDDPKHPSFAEQWLDWADEQRKKRERRRTTEA